MPAYAFTYDIESTRPDPHKPFLDAAAEEGLLYLRVVGPNVCRLPNTTVWGIFQTRALAAAAFERAVKAAAKTTGKPVNVEKRLSFSLQDSGYISDVKKLPEPDWTGSNDFETARLHQLFDDFFDE